MYKGRLAAVKLLLEKGADATIPDDEGKTPVYLALSLGDKKIIELFQQYLHLTEEDLKVLGKQIEDDLSIIAVIENGDVDKLTRFVESDIGIHKIGALHLLCLAARLGDAECVKVLLTVPRIDVNKNNDVGAPLHHAAERGHLECVKILLSVPGIDVNKKNSEGKTPIHLAAENGHLECVKTLLTVPGIDVNKESDDGGFPLSDAVKGSVECFKLLLNAPGIDVNRESKYGESILEQVIVAHNVECINMILAIPGIKLSHINEINNNHDMYSHLQREACVGHENILDVLLTIPGIDVNKADMNGDTPLHHAVREGHREIALRLLNAPGIQPDRQNCEGKTALFDIEAILDEDAEDFVVSLNEGVASSLKLQLVLKFACICKELKQRNYKDGYLQAIKLRLLRQLPRIIAGESVDDVLDINGTTALHNACALGHSTLVKMLLLKSASVYAQTAQGATVEQCIGNDTENEIAQLIYQIKCVEQGDEKDNE
ncbi:MAG: ankyrin repeat domain-containing protein [Akkermansia sp.]|nr:ankyrin repeat domain-containing protein [Akkermansia sp.]